jgi:branched-subunit amino acid aminotransferase/4-amino-4-deoxychorismate lyase|tara:strand:+ start:6812 stop:7648 length:837 start_codon:yes stop_codon:yes gene_type:complete
MIDTIGYKNGEFLPLEYCGPTILDFGFIHCDSTYDVIPIYDGKAFCLDRHLNRFVASAEYYDLELPYMHYLGVAGELMERNPGIKDAFLWIIAWRGYPKSGQPRDIKSAPVNVAMYIKPSYPLKEGADIVNVQLSDQLRVPDNVYSQAAKNFSWIDFTRAQLGKTDTYDTVVLLDQTRHITEGPGFNVGFVWEDYIYTPLNNCLNGVTMSVVEDICEDTPGQFTRCHLKEDVWNFADEIFLTSSSGGVTATQRTGKVTEWLQREYIERTKHYDYITEL